MALSTRSKVSIPDSPPSESRLLLTAKKQLIAKGSLYLEGVRAESGLQLIDSLDADQAIGREGAYRYNFEDGVLAAFKPSYIHGCVQRAVQDMPEDIWDTGFISRAQRKRLVWDVGTNEYQLKVNLRLRLTVVQAYTKFIAPYAGSAKQADWEIMVDGRQTPNVPEECPIWVNETGWTDESKLAKGRDIKKWLVGTDYAVFLAVEAKYARQTHSRVAGHVVFYTQRGARVEIRQIFPAPSDAAADQIIFTRAELFGDTLPLEPGQGPADNYIHDIAALRRRSVSALKHMSLSPV